MGLLAATLAPAASGAAPAPDPTATAGGRPASPYGTSVVIDGQGYGHGIGMSQWGALGYAVDHGWNSDQILGHYYGGTTAGTMANDDITVRLLALDGQQTVVVAAGGAQTNVDAGVGTWATVVARPIGAGRYDVWAHPTVQVCVGATDGFDPAGGWVQLAANRLGGVNEPIDVFLPGETASTPRESLLALCEPSGLVRSYRGVLRAVTGSDLEYRTVNDVPIESYLRGVVPIEVSAGWAGLGGGAGVEALEVQAVAARSYGARQTRYTYAQTCDTQACQVYGGAARRSAIGGAFTAIEHPNTDSAIVATAGMVRRTGSGAIANTMFSSSSGGYTAPSSSPGFPAVIDEGDDISINPNHDWTVTIPVSTVEAAYPAIGALSAVNVLQRNGLGADGGRVTSMRLTGSSGSVTITGDAFRRALDLKSDWFTVRGDACSGRVPPVLDGSVVSATAAGLQPVNPARVVDTRNGIGTTAVELGGGCTLAFDPGTRPLGANGVALVITTTNADANGFTTAYPCGTAQPNVSAVQVLRGVDVPGTTVVPLGASGRVCVYSSVTTDVVVDVMGWMVPGAPAYRGTAAPERLLDSRRPVPQPTLAAQTPVQVTVRGPDGSVPAAASVNLTATEAAAGGYVTAYPCDAARSETSVLNFRPGVDIANRVFVDLDSAGRLCLWASAGVHLLVDLEGVFSATDGLASPIRLQLPARVIDTRSDIGTTDPLRAGEERRLDLGAASGGVLAEVTLVSPAAAGYLTLYPCDAGRSETSVINAPRQTNVANTVLLRTDGDGQICAWSSMATELLVDVIGRV